MKLKRAIEEKDIITVRKRTDESFHMIINEKNSQNIEDEKYQSFIRERDRLRITIRQVIKRLEMNNMSRV